MPHRPQRKPRLKDWSLSKDPYIALKEVLRKGLSEKKATDYIVKTSGITEREAKIFFVENGIYFPKKSNHPDDIDLERKVELQKLSTFLDK